MLISSCSRQCFLKFKKYSQNKNSSTLRSRAGLSADRRKSLHDEENPASVSNVITPLVQSNSSDDKEKSRSNPGSDTLGEVNEDRSLVDPVVNYKSSNKSKVSQNQSELANKNWEDSEANLYWNYKAKEYFAKSREADKVQEKLDSLTKGVANVQKDMDVQQKSLRQINDRVVTLEKLMIDSHILLEKIRAAVHQEDKSLPESQKFVHVLARESPYIYANEVRFPVTEKYIPWKVPFDLYDPTLINLPKESSCFCDDERPFVEPNLLRSIMTSTENPQKLADSLVTPSTPNIQSGTLGTIETTIDTTTTDRIIPLSEYKWNQIVELQLPDGKKLLIDRTTWVTNVADKSPMIYRLDTQLLIPLNPMGRTGVRGRGALVRWGPNKSIMALITRWKKHRGQFTIVDGQRLLEALVFKDQLLNDWRLPDEKLLGIESPYGAVCRSFNILAFQDDDSERSFSLQERDMIQHFQSFARSLSGSQDSSDFQAHMVYRGYIDDVRNTDNAWVEAEIWNFHYGSNMSLPNLRTDGVASWKDVTHNSRGFLMQTSILCEIARIHDAYFE